MEKKFKGARWNRIVSILKTTYFPLEYPRGTFNKIYTLFFYFVRIITLILWPFKIGKSNFFGRSCTLKAFKKSNSFSWNYQGMDHGDRIAYLKPAIMPTSDPHFV